MKPVTGNEQVPLIVLRRDTCGHVGLQISAKLQVNGFELKQRIVVLECFNWLEKEEICGSYETLDPRQ